MALPLSRPSRPVLDYYRHECPEGMPEFVTANDLKGPNGFFRFGQGGVCYGRVAGKTLRDVSSGLFDAFPRVVNNEGSVVLPFDVNQVVDNLRFERYVQPSGRWIEKSWAKDVYYGLRPLFPGSFRKHLQKIYLRGWKNIPFPVWPLDRSVDILFEKLLVLEMRALQTDRLPFIWFWPDGHQACAIMTHDVETAAGRDFCGQMMDIDDAFGIKASFQIVPEKRYTVPAAYLETIRGRGFEVNIHGLDHEGNLFEDRETFLEFAAKINQYAALFGSQGFRSPAMYRNIDWIQELDFRLRHVCAERRYP